MSIMQILSGANTPKYQRDLDDTINPVTGGLTGTHVRASTATYIDGADGLLKTAAVDIPRFELVGGHNALLVEPAGTNVCLRSREFNHASWNYQSITRTANETGIDGVANAAYTITDVNSSDIGIVYQTITVPNDSNPACYSIYVKKDENEARFPEFQLNLTGGTTRQHKVQLNTKTGALYDRTNTGSDTYGVIDRDDWWQIWIVVTNNSTGNTTLSIYIIPAVTTVWGSTGVAAQGSIIVDAAQVELNKKIPSSFIPTVASAVTRATESGYSSYDLPSNLFDAEGTAIIWFRPGFAEAVASADGGILACNDAVSSLLYADISGNGVASHDGATEATQALAYAAYTWYKLIVKWGYDVGGTEKFRVGVDSGAGVSWGAEQTFDGSFTLGSYLRIGYGLFGPMHVRNLMLFRKALSDTMINYWGGTP